MLKDYIELGGRKFRVEANWNSQVEYLEMCGKETFEDLATVLKDITPKRALCLMAATINEGERLDGNAAKLTPEDVGAMLSRDGHEFTDFIRIYTRQGSPDLPEDGSKKKE